jgi:hypothetical protein
MRPFSSPLREDIHKDGTPPKLQFSIKTRQVWECSDLEYWTSLETRLTQESGAQVCLHIVDFLDELRKQKSHIQAGSDVVVFDFDHISHGMKITIMTVTPIKRVAEHGSCESHSLFKMFMSGWWNIIDCRSHAGLPLST